MELYIEINNNPTKEQEEIIYSYWLYDNYDFVNKPTVLAEKYGLKTSELFTLIKEYSKCRLDLGECKACGNKIVYENKSQNELNKSLSNYNILCESHREDFFSEAKKSGTKIFEFKMNAAFYYKVWETLDEQELLFFTQLIYTGSRDLIFGELFENDKEKDKFRWKMLDKFEQLGLLRIVRTENNSIRKFLFNSKMKNRFVGTKIDTDSFIEDSDQFGSELKFVLNPNKNKIEQKHPNYSIIKKFDTSMLIERGKTYRISAWLREVNNTISINISPYIGSKSENDSRDKAYKPLYVKYVEMKDPKKLPNPYNSSDGLDNYEDEVPF